MFCVNVSTTSAIVYYYAHISNISIDYMCKCKKNSCMDGTHSMHTFKHNDMNFFFLNIPFIDADKKVHSELSLDVNIQYLNTS